MLAANTNNIAAAQSCAGQEFIGKSRPRAQRMCRLVQGAVFVLPGAKPLPLILGRVIPIAGLGGPLDLNRMFHQHADHG